MLELIKKYVTQGIAFGFMPVRDNHPYMFRVSIYNWNTNLKFEREVNLKDLERYEGKPEEILSSMIKDMAHETC